MITPTSPTHPLPNYILYTLPNCVGCNLTKRTLKTHPLPYATVDLSNPVNAPLTTKLKQLGHLSAPILLVTETGDYISDIYLIQKQIKTKYNNTISNNETEV